MKKRLEPILYLFVLNLLLWGTMTNCAKVVNPTGGPMDTIPPVPVKADPPNFSTHFKSNEIEIQFNEFIQLRDLKKQFISSPPFREDPRIKEKGDKIEISIEDTLRSNTTYTLNFGNSIVDFHESNPLKNFRYVFSTGSHLDSLELYGEVVDAQTKQPVENTLVMLYSKRKDSIPFLEIPEYVSRTDEKGQYYIGNIRHDSFKIFALNDENSNYLYDSPNEEIAFSDSLITFEKERVEVRDTVFEDTVRTEFGDKEIADTIIRVHNGRISMDTLIPGEEDSILIDTVFYSEYMGYKAQRRSLKLFDEENRPQYLKTSLREDKRKISFIFNRPVIDSIRKALIDSTEHLEDLYVSEKKKVADTITYWIKDSSLYNRELLTYWVEYKRRDSLNQYYWHRDTVKFRYTFREDEKKTGPDTLNLMTNLTAGRKVDLGQKIIIKSEYPLKSFDTSRICLWEKVDSVLVERDIEVFKKKEDLYSLVARTKWNPESDYKFVVLPRSIHPIYNFYQDTLERELSTRKENYYGQINLEIKGTKIPALIQLMDDKNKVIQEEWLKQTEGSFVSLRYLHPGKKKLRAVLDENKNKKWDTGNYLEHRQPEEVYYYPDEINVRSNWELDLEWEIKQKKNSNP